MNKLKYKSFIKELSERGSVLILDYLSLNYEEILHNETEFDSHSIKRRELENLHHEARSLRDLDNLLVASPDVESEGSADNFEQIGVDFIPDLFFDSSSSSSDFSFYDDVSDTPVYNGEVLVVFDTQIFLKVTCKDFRAPFSAHLKACYTNP